jgi:hypothetical protein
MRFSTLLKKELRESLPWMLLAAIAFFAMGGFFLWSEAYNASHYWRYSRLSPATILSYYDLSYHPEMMEMGNCLLLVSIGLGLVLGVRHFWIPHFTRTWPFLLHRSTNRQTILAAKLSAAAIAFVISLGSVWIVFYQYACREGAFAIPPTPRTFIEGWIFIMLGIVVYLATALSGLSRARWYTTKIFGLAFATIVIIWMFGQWRLISAFVMIVACAAILLLQIYDTFGEREF